MHLYLLHLHAISIGTSCGILNALIINSQILNQFQSKAFVGLEWLIPF